MRSISAILLASALIAPLSVAPAGFLFPAHAQAGGPQQGPLKQVALTDAQIQSYIAAQLDVGAIFAKLSPEASDKPDPKIQAALEAAAKKHKFANFADYSVVAANIELVVNGIDPATKSYVGAAAMFKKQLAEIQADPKMSAADKKAATDEMTAEMKSTPPVKIPANIDLVVKNFDAIVAAMPHGEPPAQ